MDRIYLWDSVERDCSGKPSYGSSGSSMYREGDFVYYEYYDFDREDNRRYDYWGKFKLSEYQNAIKEVIEKKVARLEGEENITLRMAYDGGFVRFNFFSTPSPCSSPGGALISGTQGSSHRLEEIVLV